MASSDIQTSGSQGVADRVPSVDIVRGIIMILMALDHVRDYFHITALTADPLAPDTTTSSLYFTRWITHLCAPTFLLLSGISSYLSGRRQSAAEKSVFLIKRGIWLVVVEIVVMSLILTFDITYRTVFLQVIWALGWSMVVLGILIRFLSPSTILICGLILVFGHNVFDLLNLPAEGPVNVLVTVLFTASGSFYPRADGGTIAVLYAVLPWTGIMLVGYGMGQLYEARVSAKQRKKILLWAGIASLVLFVLLRVVNGYGDPSKWSTQATGWRTFLSFLNTTKYPPSLLYSLMTVGITLLMLYVSDQLRNGVGVFVSVFGKVPFFYFVLHFLVIHIVSALVVLASGYSLAQANDPSLIFRFRPFDFGYALWLVYLIWIGLVLLMYGPSKWFARYKASHKSWWLSYL
jgi:uncharacterized membrane protein